MKGREMKKFRLEGESGFTLIELLVVVAIIGILAAIAIPQFAAYRKRGHEAQVKSDLRNAAVAQEAYFAANSAYKSSKCFHGLNGSRLQPHNRSCCVCSGRNEYFSLDCYAHQLRYERLDLQ